MTTSLKRRSLSKPKQGKRIELYDLAFVRSRNRNKAHSLLLEEFKKSGLSKAEVAKMLGKRPEQITRWLAGPRNLTLDTISDLIFALRGEFFALRCSDDLSKGKSNHCAPEWLALPIGRPSWEAILVGDHVSDDQKDEGKTNKYSIKTFTTSVGEDQIHGRYKAVEDRTIAKVS